MLITLDDTNEVTEYITNKFEGIDFFESILENNEGNLVGYKHDIVRSYFELIACKIVDEEKEK